MSFSASPPAVADRDGSRRLPRPPLTAGQSLREVVAGLVVLLGAVLGAVALPALWVQENIVDRDGFLAITQPLSSDPAFQQEVVDETVTALENASPLPAWAEDRLEPVARDQAERLVDTQVFDTIWQQSMEEVHAQLFASDGPIVLSADLQPAVDAVLEPVNDLLPPGLSVPEPTNTTVQLASIPRAGWLGWLQYLDPWAGRAAMAAVVCGVLALLIAPRRAGMLAACGVAVMAVGAVAAVVAASIAQIVPDMADQAPVLGAVVRAFEVQFAADMAPQAMTLLLTGGAIVVVAIVLGVLLQRGVH